MNRAIYASTILLLIAASFVGGALWSRHASPGRRIGGTEGALLRLPDAPAVRSDRPGDCPSCGMRLEPVYEDGGATTAAAVRAPRSRPAPCR